jgi:hypothetical protein
MIADSIIVSSHIERSPIRSLFDLRLKAKFALLTVVKRLPSGFRPSSATGVFSLWHFVGFYPYNRPIQFATQNDFPIQ